MAAGFIRRYFVFWRPLFTPEEMYAQLVAHLGSSLDEHMVIEALMKIDRFDAGAVDPHLTAKIMRVLNGLKRRDRAADIETLKRADKYNR